MPKASAPKPTRYQVKVTGSIMVNAYNETEAYNIARRIVLELQNEQAQTTSGLTSGFDYVGVYVVVEKAEHYRDLKPYEMPDYVPPKKRATKKAKREPYFLANEPKNEIVTINGKTACASCLYESDENGRHLDPLTYLGKTKKNNKNNKKGKN